VVKQDAEQFAKISPLLKLVKVTVSHQCVFQIKYKRAAVQQSGINQRSTAVKHPLSDGLLTVVRLDSYKMRTVMMRMVWRLVTD